ncbi:hypothetical protein AVEN_257276-1 [Araneus ventricosus]|uniref:Uncharacterized protein n=1 Tax=Araneus ventricosus TaxID=182803 RepID=A0A4Y2HBK3_ARAVE|nr:hypothetical protein AVEN_257276-1 [Araneus ventricosus]
MQRDHHSQSILIQTTGILQRYCEEFKLRQVLMHMSNYLMVWCAPRSKHFPSELFSSAPVSIIQVIHEVNIGQLGVHEAMETSCWPLSLYIYNKEPYQVLPIRSSDYAFLCYYDSYRSSLPPLQVCTWSFGEPCVLDL